MARTEVRGGQIKDTTVQRTDLDTSTSGEAVIRRIIAGTNITIGSTGVDTGTGDVTINATAGGGGSDVDLSGTDVTIPSEKSRYVSDLFEVLGTSYLSLENNAIMEIG